MQVQIIGGGQAGIEVVSYLRRNGFTGQLHLFCGEGVLPYQRPPLSKEFILGKKSEETILFKNRDFFEKQHIQVSFDWIVEIDRQKQWIKDCQSKKYPYDILILATGSKSRVFTLPESSQFGDSLEIFRLRTLADAHRICQIIQEDQQTGRLQYLIIGGGFIGLELASALSLMNVSVTILEMSPRLMGRMLSESLSHWFLQLHKENAINVLLNARVIDMKQPHDVRIAVSDCEGKERIIDQRFDRLISGIGAEVDVSLAKCANLDCDRQGIQVNEFMQTSDPKIYAIGDCTSHKNPFLHLEQATGTGEFQAASRIRLESVQNAVAQAKTAADHILGDPMPYNACPWFWSVQHGVSLQMAGLHDGYDQVCWRGDILDQNGSSISSISGTKGTDGKPKSSCFYFRKGHFIACHSVNAPSDHFVARSLLQQRLSPEIAQIEDKAINLRSLI